MKERNSDSSDCLANARQEFQNRRSVSVASEKSEFETKEAK